MQFVPGKMMKKKSNKRPRPKAFAPVPQIYRRGPKMEVKYVDNAATDDNFQLVGGTPWILINGIVQGAGNNQRIGNKSKPKGLTYERTNIKLSNSSASLC